MIIPFLQGFGASGGLIVAIGAQNAYLLSQSVRRRYPLIIASICAVCDALFITAGVAGVGTVVAGNPKLVQIAAWGGALFLIWYGWNAFRSALRGGTLESDGAAATSLRSAVLTTLAVTLLNPHVYIDTILLLGGISGQFQGTGRLMFGVGAVSASFVWFFSLGFGGRFLAPLFRKPGAWRILDGAICAVMWSIAASLVFNGLEV